MQQGLKTYFVSQLHRVRKKGTDSITVGSFFPDTVYYFGRNFDKFRQLFVIFEKKIILTLRVTEKL